MNAKWSCCILVVLVTATSLGLLRVLTLQGRGVFSGTHAGVVRTLPVKQVPGLVGQSRLDQEIVKRLEESHRQGNLPNTFVEEGCEGKPIHAVDSLTWWWLPNGLPNDLSKPLPTYDCQVYGGTIANSQISVDLRYWVVENGIVGCFKFDKSRIQDEYHVSIVAVNALFADQAPLSDRPLFMATVQLRVRDRRNTVDEICGETVRILLGRVLGEQRKKGDKSE